MQVPYRVSDHSSICAGDLAKDRAGCCNELDAQITDCRAPRAVAVVAVQDLRCMSSARLPLL